jgi:hypothetical protein
MPAVLKNCPKCPDGQTFKSLSEFRKDCTTRDQRYYICKKCEKEKKHKSQRALEDVVGENETDGIVDSLRKYLKHVFVMITRRIRQTITRKQQCRRLPVQPVTVKKKLRSTTSHR